MTTFRAVAAFTLIETLVAIVLVAVVLPVALAGVGSALHGADVARRQDVARRIAGSRLAQLVADGSWSGSATSGDCDPVVDGEDAVGFHWQLTLTPWRDPTLQDLRLSVGWGSSDDPGAVAMETLVVPPTGTAAAAGAVR